MTAVHSKNLQVFNASKFKESMALSSNLFFTIGKVLPWTNESVPNQANTSVREFYEVWDNMIGGKRITANDIRHCIPRYNWQEGAVYSQYDDTVDSKSMNNPAAPYYVMTEDWNVYKCISNNKNNMVSSVKPTQTPSSGYNLTTADGYVWKYMYTVSPSDRMRFTTEQYIPITPSPLVQSGAVSGEISSIVVTDSGENYDANTLSVIFNGNGTGALPNVHINTLTNTIDKITLDSKGTGYTWADISIYSDAGVNAAARVVLSPPGGHGSDPYSELGASYLIINPQLKGDEGGSLIVNNEYRQIAIIDSPLLYGTTIVSSNTVFTQLMEMTLNGISVDYQLDEIAYIGDSLETATFTGVVADWNSTGANSKIKLCNLRGTPDNQQLIGANTTARRYVDNIVTQDLQPYSGRLLYKDNIESIGRAVDQTDAFQIILKF